MTRLHCALLWLVVVFVSMGGTARAEPPPPNVVLIFADDLGYGDLGVYGHPTIRTPHLDGMAQEGQKWTSFYAQTSVCSPSRATLLTGRLHLRSGMYGRKTRVLFPDSTSGLPASETTLAEVLKDLGYVTAMVGKWHLGHLPAFLPTAHGFDSWFGIPYSNDMDWTLDSARTTRRDAYYHPKVEYWNVPLMSDQKVVEQPAQQATLTRRYTERALSFIRKNRRRSFFLYLAHTMPHMPLFPSPQFRGKSDAGVYGDVVGEIDWSVGQILDTLRQTGLAERTLVIFTSDNGPWLLFRTHGGSAGGLRQGKGTTWEGGMRVPAIFWWPGTLKPGTVAEMGSTMDLLPTLVKLAGSGNLPGQKADYVIDGVDLSPALLGTGPSPRHTMLYYRGDTLFALRKGMYKAHFKTQGAYGEGPSLEEHDPPLLYHLGEDPGERWDIASDHPEIVADLMREAREHLDSFTAAQPLFDLRGAN